MRLEINEEKCWERKINELNKIFSEKKDLVIE